MNREVGKAALIGVAHGVTSSILLFVTSDRHTLADDWFLAVMIVAAMTTGFAIAAWHRVSLLGVALAGLVGMMAGGWVGTHAIGSYEYTIPAPPKDREMRIIVGGKERVIELKDAPTEKVKRVPIGGGLGVLVGFAVAALVYGRLARPKDDEPVS